MSGGDANRPKSDPKRSMTAPDSRTVGRPASGLMKPSGCVCGSGQASFSCRTRREFRFKPTGHHDIAAVQVRDRRVEHLLNRGVRRDPGRRPDRDAGPSSSRCLGRRISESSTDLSSYVSCPPRTAAVCRVCSRSFVGSTSPSARGDGRYPDSG